MLFGFVVGVIVESVLLVAKKEEGFSGIYGRPGGYRRQTSCQPLIGPADEGLFKVRWRKWTDNSNTLQTNQEKE
jgi:hypothetical protein